MSLVRLRKEGVFFGTSLGKEWQKEKKGTAVGYKNFMALVIITNISPKNK